MSKVNKSIRFNAETLEAAEILGIDISEVCREALERAIDAWDGKTKTQTQLTEVLVRVNAKLGEKKGKL